MDPSTTDGGACAVFLIVTLVALFVFNIVLLVWIARDAKARGMGSPVVWMLVVFFLSIFGLLLYLLSRPKGKLARCSSCNNKRLAVSATCPHCGNA